MPKSSKKQIDEDEKTLLKALQQNSGESIEQIAKKCNFSRQKVWRIKKRLENNKTIWGNTAIIDYENIGMKKYLILLKRTNLPISPDKLQIPIKGNIEKELEKIGIEVDFNFLLHGEYDLAMCVTAPGVREIIVFTNLLTKLFGEYISESKILDVIFPLQIGGIKNPNIDQLNEFFL
jgi:DNA-binding Lrp family transcriptional regulator